MWRLTLKLNKFLLTCIELLPIVGIVVKKIHEFVSK